MMVAEPVPLDTLKRVARRDHRLSESDAIGLIHELEALRVEIVRCRRVHALALDDRDHWKKLWQAKLAESEHRWGLYCAALNSATRIETELRRAREDRDDYQESFHNADAERETLAELVITLRAELYMAREM